MPTTGLVLHLKTQEQTTYNITHTNATETYKHNTNYSKRIHKYLPLFFSCKSTSLCHSASPPPAPLAVAIRLSAEIQLKKGFLPVGVVVRTRRGEEKEEEEGEEEGEESGYEDV